LGDKEIKMHWIDLGILIILVLFIFFGFRKGLLHEILGLIGLIAAFFCSIQFGERGSPLLQRLFGLSSSFAGVLSYLIIFIGVLLLFYSLSALVSRLIRATPLALIDRVGGMVLGLLKGSLFLSMLLLVLASSPLSPKITKKLEGSVAVLRIRQVAPLVYGWVKDIWPSAKSLYESLKEEKPQIPLEDLKKKEAPSKKKNGRTHPKGLRI